MNAATLHFDAQSHRYTLDGVELPSVTQILSPLNSAFRYASPAALDAARALGTAVHRACELDDAGVLDERSMADCLHGYVRAWRRFCADHQTHWLMTETAVCNPQMGYAGTLDRYGFVDGDKTVVDLKTGAALYPAVGPQLAAYAKAIPDASACTRRIAVLLRPTGHYDLQSFRSASDWAVFASLLTLRNFCQLHKITPHYGVPR
jgi:hypothetical protein